jgi:CO dehydrogenase/acetyl-CoA synthase delta subunit
MNANEKEWRELQALIESVAETLAEAVNTAFKPDGSGEPSKDPRVQALIARLDELRRRLVAVTST